MVGFQKHLSGKAELTSLFPVFLDYAFASLKETIDCVGLKCSFKSPLYVREWRRGLVKLSRTWKAIQMQLVIIFNLCVFITLRKHVSLGHFVLWWLTPHAIIPNPKGYGPLAQISIVGLPSFFGEWAGKLSSHRCLWGWGRWIRLQAKTRKREMRWGWEESLCNWTWLSLILKESLLCFCGRSSNQICSRILGPMGSFSFCGPIPSWKPPSWPSSHWMDSGNTTSHRWPCSPRSGGIFVVCLSWWSLLSFVWIFSFSIILVTNVYINFLWFERYRIAFVFLTAPSLVCSTQTVL